MLKRAAIFFFMYSSQGKTFHLTCGRTNAAIHFIMLVKVRSGRYTWSGQVGSQTKLSIFGKFIFVCYVISFSLRMCKVF